MNAKVRVVTDSACDLPPEIIQDWNISVVPLIVRFGSEVYTDDELPVDAFWERATGPEPPYSSQPPVGAFEEVFGQAVRAGKQVVCVTVTSKHSGTFNSASTAAQRFAGEVYVFDSLSLSVGEGMLALAAAEAAYEGHSPEEIVAMLTEWRDRLQVLILLDTLEYLRRGGRADRFIRVLDRITRTFNIKPVINVVDGQLQLMSAVRSFRTGLERLLQSAETLGPAERLGVIHTRRREMAVEIADTLASRMDFPREKIWVREACSALSSHAGPGTIGIAILPRRV